MKKILKNKTTLSLEEYRKLALGDFQQVRNNTVFDTGKLTNAYINFIEDKPDGSATQFFNYLIDLKYERELKCTCKENAKQRAICPVCDKEKYQQNLKDNNERFNRM